MKYILTILTVVFSLSLSAQNTHTQSNSNTNEQFQGSVESKIGFINAHFSDTAAANLSWISGKPFAQIVTGDGLMWLRNGSATRWIGTGTSSIKISPDSSSLIICNAISACDTIQVLSVAPITNFTVINDTTIVVCGNSCDTIHTVPVNYNQNIVNSVSVVNGSIVDSVFYFINGIKYLAGTINTGGGGSAVSISTDSSALYICNNSSCDTFLFSSIAPIQNFTIVNDTTIVVCGNSSCDTLHTVPTVYSKYVDSVAIISGDTLKYFINGQGIVGGYFSGSYYSKTQIDSILQNYGFNQDGRISGGIVSWTGSGLSFDVSASVFRKLGVIYHTNDTTITLNPADVTYSRIDLFALDTTNGGEVIKITGTPAPTPVAPQVLDYQIALTTGITLNVGDTVPANVSIQKIYDENIEWATSTNGEVTVNFNDVSNPFSGTKDALISSYGYIGRIVFTRSGTGVMDGSEVLKMHISLRDTLRAGRYIRVLFLNNSTPLSSTIVPITKNNGLDPNIVNQYQTIQMPASVFQFTSTTYNRLIIYATGYDTSGTGGFYLDDVELQSGINNVPSQTDISGKVNYTDSLTKYVTPTQLAALHNNLNLYWPLYGDNADTSVHFKNDSLPRLDYATSVRDTSTWNDNTLIDKLFLHDRLAEVTSTGITRTELQDTASAIRSSMGSGSVQSVTGNPTNLVDNTDPANPIIQQDASKVNISDTAAMLSPYQKSITLTTIGISGAATLTGNNLNIPQYSGSGGSPNISIGSGIKIAVDGTNNVKSIIANAPLSADSTTNANAVTFKADTTVSNPIALATQNQLGKKADTSGMVKFFFTSIQLNDLFRWDTTNGGRIVNVNYNWLTDSTDVIHGRTFFRYGKNNVNTATDLTAIGYHAAILNTTGTNNTAVGNIALKSNITGSHNTAFGWNANGSVTASYATAVGDNANGGGATGSSTSNITAIGANAMGGSWSGSGNNNTAIGGGAIYGGSGLANTAVGSSAMGGTTNSGSNNTAIGYNSLANSPSSGSNNGAFGAYALRYNSTGSNLIALNTLNRSNSTGDSTKSPIFIIENATVGSQITTVNGNLSINTNTPPPYASFIDVDTAKGWIPPRLTTSQRNAIINGITLGGTIVTSHGTGYTNGLYTNVNLIGGNGINAKASITVTANIVTAIGISASGSNYILGDTLSANTSDIGGTGSGFYFIVTSLTYTQPGLYLYDSTIKKTMTFDGTRYTEGAKIISSQATLDFPSTPSTSVSDLTVTVIGAELNDVVTIGVPHAAMTATASYFAWVSAANTVTIRFAPKATEDPASGIFKIKVFKD